MQNHSTVSVARKLRNETHYLQPFLEIAMTYPITLAGASTNSMQKASSVLFTQGAMQITHMRTHKHTHTLVHTSEQCICKITSQKCVMDYAGTSINSITANWSTLCFTNRDMGLNVSLETLGRHTAANTQGLYRET